MNRTIPEPARALGWHLARAFAVIAAVAIVVAFGSLLLLAVGYAVAGYGSWWPPGLLFVAAVAVSGVVSWLRAAKERP